MKVTKILDSVKYLLSISNGLLLLTSIYLILEGVIILLEFNKYDSLMTRRFFNLAHFVIATGVIVVCVSVLGLYSTVSQNFFVILSYLVVVLVILVFDIAMIIEGFKLHADASSLVQGTMAENMKQYESKIEVAKTWDEMQRKFECCGISGRNDWLTSKFPVSCCHIDYGTVSPFECKTSNAYTVGCGGILSNRIGINAYIIGISGVVVIVAHAITVGIGAWVAYKVKTGSIDLETSS